MLKFKEKSKIKQVNECEWESWTEVNHWNLVYGLNVITAKTHLRHTHLYLERYRFWYVYRHKELLYQSYLKLLGISNIIQMQ